VPESAAKAMLPNVLTVIPLFISAPFCERFYYRQELKFLLSDRKSLFQAIGAGTNVAGGINDYLGSITNSEATDDLVSGVWNEFPMSFLRPAVLL
jgi:hypothetical protein